MAFAPLPRTALVSTLLAGTVAFVLHAQPALAHGSVDHEIAEATLRIDAEPTNAAEFLRRGELHRLRHDWKAALADYATAARLDPSMREESLCRAALDLDRGRPGAARNVLDRLLAQDPVHAEALRLRAEAWSALGRPKDAMRDYDHLIGRNAHPTPDHYLARARAAAATGKGGLEEALRGLDLGIERLGPLVSLESHAIDLELERRNFDGALSRLDAIAPQFGRRETLYERRGTILVLAGRDEEARAAFAEALLALAALPAERRSGPAAQEMETRLKTRLAAAELAAPASPLRSNRNPGVTR